jgi:hypothetical protein
MPIFLKSQPEWDEGREMEKCICVKIYRLTVHVSFQAILSLCTFTIFLLESVFTIKGKTQRFLCLN